MFGVNAIILHLSLVSKNVNDEKNTHIAAEFSLLIIQISKLCYKTLFLLTSESQIAMFFLQKLNASRDNLDLVEDA